MIEKLGVLDMKFKVSGVVLTSSLLLSACSSGDGLTADERELFSALDNAISEGEPLPQQVVASLNLPPECLEDACFLEGEALGRWQFESGNFRSNEEGLVLVLEDWSGSCVRIAAARAHFETGEPEQGCSHGGCWHTKSERPWGIVSFSLDQPDAECISDAVINTRY